MHVRLQGTGPPVLLLHGFPTSGRLWDRVVPVLEREFTCVVVDLPGLGESQPLEGFVLDADLYAQELERLRKELSFSSWHIVGHDAGSTIAVHYAARFSMRLNKLVLCSPPIFPEHRIPWIFRLMRTPLIGEFAALMMIRFLWRFGFHLKFMPRDKLTEDIVEAFRRPFAGFRGMKRFVHLVRWGDPVKVLAKTAALLPDITASTLILHGVDDGVIPITFATRAADIIPYGEAEFMDCGHFLPLYCAEALSERLLCFLRE